MRETTQVMGDGQMTGKIQKGDKSGKDLGFISNL